VREEIIAELHVQPDIDVKAEIERRVNFLVEYSTKTNTNGFVLGISGGADSTLAGKLAQMAVNIMNDKGGQKQFIALRLPYHEQLDEHDAQNALQFIAPSKTITFNIASGVDALTESYELATGKPISDFHKGNIKARVRMLTQYAIAGEENMLVIGTDHAAESVTGFFTKFGDGAADILPLSGLIKSQVRMLLHELGADKPLSEKPPTADLLDQKPQQLDETELGLSYEIIDKFLSGQHIPSSDEEKLVARYKATTHKRKLPVTIYDHWWR